MSEDEARKKWCPAARSIITDEPSWNRTKMLSVGAADPRCVASDCMMWRWSEPMFNGPDSYVSEPGPEGYCGLAGRPVS